MHLTYSQIHVLLDALARHTVALELGDTTPPDIYMGVFPDTHPLRDIATYRAIVDAATETLTEVLGATTDGEIVKITVLENA